jgi:hypothetical protein
MGALRARGAEAQSSEEILLKKSLLISVPLRLARVRAPILGLSSQT